ncbi:hypothetical protein OHV05_37675 (plasmid) [Kitasatospora sp. NBC_00070]|uniref:hypothetical protein n=1 Tax=Kitasatospora sp. NBC_00070 TaxID=2975962 RepID=UPI0032511DE2
MHHVVTLSGLGALILAFWAVQLTTLALHVRYSIRHGIARGLGDNTEFALITACVIATLASAVGEGNAISASLNATQWG